MYLFKALATHRNIFRRTRPNIVIRMLLTMLDTHITLLETRHFSHSAILDFSWFSDWRMELYLTFSLVR